MPKRSQNGTNGARRGAQRAAQTPITKAEALELLTSAASYCARSGLEIEAVRLADGRVALALAGVTASVTDGRVEFVVTPTVPA